MKRNLMSAAFMAVLAGIAPAAAAQTPSAAQGGHAGWGVLSELAGRKFVWNSGRARGSDDSELTFHEFQWRGDALAQTQCSYWPLRNLKAVCGTNIIETLADGSLLLKANGGKPHFKGAPAAGGSVEFVNKTMFGAFVTAFVAQPDGSVAMVHRNRVDGESRAPLIPVDAAREAEIMADMESIYAAAQAQKREEAERRYAAFMGAMQGMNTVLAAGLEVANANEARSRAQLDRTIAQAGGARPPASGSAGGASAPGPGQSAGAAATSPGGGGSASGSGAITVTAADRTTVAGAASGRAGGTMLGFCSGLTLGGFERDHQAVIYVSGIGPVDYAFGQPMEPLKEAYAAKLGVRGLIPDCMVSTDRAVLERKRQEAIDNRGYPNAKRVMTGL